MRERDAAVVVSKFHRSRGSVLKVGQMVGREAVTQRVVRPLSDVGGLPRLNEIFIEVLWRDRASVLANRQQPLAQIGLDGDESALRCLGFFGFDFDQAGLEIDFASIESLQLRTTQTGKESDCDVWQSLRRCDFK